MSHITRQDFYSLASTLANINELLILNLYHLISTLTNTNDILKVDLYYLANTLINTNDKTDNSIKKMLVVLNQLLTPYHQLDDA